MSEEILDEQPITDGIEQDNSTDEPIAEIDKAKTGNLTVDDILGMSDEEVAKL